jgi:hypothetical protein
MVYIPFHLGPFATSLREIPIGLDKSFIGDRFGKNPAEKERESYYYLLMLWDKLYGYRTA